MIAFATGFRGGPSDKPDRRRRSADVARRTWLDAGQRLALAGAALVGGGVFLPFIRYGPIGSSSLWHQEFTHGMPLGSVALLTLGLLSAVLALRRCYLFLWITGFAAYMALACAFLLSVHLTNLTTEPVAPDVGATVEFEIGWCVMVLGIVLLFVGALIDGILDSRRAALQRSACLYTDSRRSAFSWFAHCHRGGRVRDG
jgi:hypothetical protein